MLVTDLIKVLENEVKAHAEFSSEPLQVFIEGCIFSGNSELEEVVNDPVLYIEYDPGLDGLLLRASVGVGG